MVGLWCLNPGWMVVSALIVLRWGVDHPSTQISDLLPHCVPCPGPPRCHAFSQALVTVLQRVTVLFPPPHPICLILSSHKARAMSHSPTVFFNSHLVPAVVFIGHVSGSTRCSSQLLSLVFTPCPHTDGEPCGR